MMGFLLLLGFYTRLPLPRVTFEEATFRKAVPLLPLVGLIVGILLAALALIARVLALPPLVCGAILLAAYVVITGGLHLDGLADTCDGLFSGRGRERALEIMKDSHVGSFGVLALVVAGAGYLALFSYASVAAILGATIIGRVAPLVSLACAPHARQNGLAVQAGRVSPKTAVAVALIATLGTVALTLICVVASTLFAAIPDALSAVPFALVAPALSTLLAALVALLGTVAFSRYLKRHLGGVTGDTLGASIELTQLCFLLVALLAGNLV
jgi:adenosylcobinamide-GDP ribazoletransferase